MLLNIYHRTHYRYDAPQSRFIQSLRMTPSNCESQKILDWSINVEGAKLDASFVDGSGDRITTLTLPGPFDEIELIVSGQVQTTDTTGILRKHKETISPLVYLRHTRLTARDAALATLAAEVACEYEPGSLDLAHALCNAVAAAIPYQPGVTHHDMTAAEALASGAGVCQDHAHMLIALAQANGYPARYVVGYLHSDAAGKSHGASHAWCEIHIDGLGWVGFDATNNCCPDERYLRLGSGLDAHHAAPIRGIAYGTGEEEMDASVVVECAQQ